VRTWYEIESIAQWRVAEIEARLARRRLEAVLDADAQPLRRRMAFLMVRLARVLDPEVLGRLPDKLPVPKLFWD
jgi:hypothetical protein